MKIINDEAKLNDCARYIYNIYRSLGEQKVKYTNEFYLSMPQNEAGEITDNKDFVNKTIEAFKCLKENGVIKDYSMKKSSDNKKLIFTFDC